MRYANEIIVEALREDRGFLKEHLTNAIFSMFHKDIPTACLMIRDIVNATTGFPDLAIKLNRKDKGKGLMQMLSKNSNPSAASLFAIIGAVLEHEGIEIVGTEIKDKAA